MGESYWQFHRWKIEANGMDEAALRVEAARRLMVNVVLNPTELATISDDFETHIGYVESSARVGNRVLAEDVALRLESFRARLNGVYLRVPALRPGWQARSKGILLGDPPVRGLDTLSALECLSCLGDPEVMTAYEWSAPKTNKCVLTLMRELAGRLAILESITVNDASGWISDQFDSGWTDSHQNYEFGYSEVLRAMHTTSGNWHVPDNPRGAGPHLPYTRYWFTLATVLVGHLGWRQPAVGLAAWILRGMPDDGAILSSVKALWGLHAAALLNPSCDKMFFSISSKIYGEGPANISRIETNRSALAPLNFLKLSPGDGNERLRRDVLQGVAGLHLETHVPSVLINSEDLPSLPAQLIFDAADTTKRTASLLVKENTGWHSELNMCGRELPRRTDGHSWRVHVTSTRYGYIGEFRKSRITGLWFAGKHSSHMLGNPI